MSAYLTKKQTARCRVGNSEFDFQKKKKKKLNLTHLNANSLITSSEFIKAE